jgi:HEAT repeat protein
MMHEPELMRESEGANRLFGSLTCMTEGEWEDLVQALRQDDASIAASAAERLHKRASTEDLPRLLVLLNNDDIFLREAAAWPISELAGSSSMHDLLIAYQRGFDEGYDNDGFTTALVELATQDPIGCRNVLLRLAESPTTTLRDNAAWLLDFCKPAI